jgi:hypothetical protein
MHLTCYSASRNKMITMNYSLSGATYMDRGNGGSQKKEKGGDSYRKN